MKKSVLETSCGAVEAAFWVRVKPRARENIIVGWDPAGFLEIRVRAMPVAGAANRACTEEIARALGIAPNRVVLEKGPAAKHKKIRISGISNEEVRMRLADARISK